MPYVVAGFRHPPALHRSDQRLAYPALWAGRSKPDVGQSLESALWQSLAWIAATLIVFIPLATRAYKRA